MTEAIAGVWHLLKTNAALIAVVPAASIYSGVIPHGIATTCIGLNHISSVRHRTTNSGVDEFCTSRVQVTVHADLYETLPAVLALVRAALPKRPGTVNGCAIDSILIDGEGPDFRNDAAGIYMRSQDVLVRWNET